MMCLLIGRLAVLWAIKWSHWRFGPGRPLVRSVQSKRPFLDDQARMAREPNVVINVTNPVLNFESGDHCRSLLRFGVRLCFLTTFSLRWPHILIISR